MADVLSFRGIRYTPAHVPDASAVITPPYDVISAAQQKILYDRHPNNMIQLELGYEYATDTALDNRYTRAAMTFAQWRFENILAIDTTPGYYLYQQQFRVAGTTYTRTSILARVRLEPWEMNIILPHERTLAKAKSDRLSLLRACGANFSPIMALFDDDNRTIQSILANSAATPPLVEAVDDAGEQHRLWMITDPAIIATLQQQFANKQLFIADGHHRYETALAYREEVRELHRGLAYNEGANFVMMALIPTDDPGIVIFPTHRMFKGIEQQHIDTVLDSIRPFWTIESLDTGLAAEQIVQHLNDAGTAANNAVVLVMPQQTVLLTITPAGREHMALTGESAAWQQLDVAAVQELIIDAGLGIPRDAVTSHEGVTYTRAAEAAIEAVRTGAAQIAIVLNPTRAKQIRDVALAHGLMPQKSTYFYPKLITGLVINPVW